MTRLYFDPLFLEHDTGHGHPERADRLRHVMDGLDASRIPGLHKAPSWDPAEISRLEAVHLPEYVAFAVESCRTPGALDADTIVSAKSSDAARLAAGAAVDAVRAVMEGEAKNAFCAVRPPGHHAERDRAMGFCLFNNVAVAATALLDSHDVERVLIIDWDVHHGNGTQQAFYDDGRVYFLSFHQSPLYPGTGAATETGMGAGENATQNVLFAPHSSPATYIERFKTVVRDVADRFSPDFILLSAGFDAHRDDPLAQQQLEDDDFADLTEIVLEAAEQKTGGRLVSMLEGGYNLDALQRSVQRHVSLLAKA